MKRLVRPLLPALLTGVLSACGGGVGIGLEFVDDDDGEVIVDDRPFSSGRPGSVTVNAASDPQLVGTYASDNVRVTHVFRFPPVAGFPETCRFQFDDLKEARTGAFMFGEIQYLPGTDTVHASFIVVDFREFLVEGNATLDRANNAIVYNQAVLTSTEGTGQSITISGTIPMQNESKPAGC